MAGGVRVRLATLALLACGAFALPSTRVTFMQHGVNEGEDAVMYAPSDVESRKASLTPQLLSSAIARVMSLDARAEVDTALPAGDIFNRPDGNVLVFVDGLRPRGSPSTPYMKDWLEQKDSSYFLRTPTEDAWTSGLAAALGDSFDVASTAAGKGGVICAAADHVLASLDACSQAELAFPVDSRRSLLEEDVKLGPGVLVDSSSGLRTISLSGADGETLTLDLHVEADFHLVEELNFLGFLPASLAQRFDADEKSSPPLVIMYLSSLKAIRKEYGANSVKSRLAHRALDAALAEALGAMSSGAGRRLTSQLVVGTSLTDRLAVGGRRLATESSNTTTNVTLTEIVQFQLNMWTGVGLALIGFLAIYATITMDIQPDSLLYAKFIADTSGGGLKTD